VISLGTLAGTLLGGEPGRAATSSVDNAPPDATPKEIELGKKAADEFEKAKTTKLLDAKSSPENGAMLLKLNGMVKKLGAASGRPGIQYTVKIVDEKDVNAFTLPNGHIYVYKGLLDFAASDDELAGVLGHEIGHNVRMHALRGEAKAKKLSWVNLAAMAAMIAGGTNGANVGQFSQYLLVGVMNGYGVEYEKEADACAVPEMIKAGYNPSAIVTFMQRLELQEERSPEVHLGIFQTHPPSDERAEACLAAIKAAGVTYRPREVTGAKTAVVEEKEDRYCVNFGDLTLIELARSGKTARTRADSAAARINSLMRDGLQTYEVTVSASGQLLGRGQEIATAIAADGALPTLAPVSPSKAVANGAADAKAGPTSAVPTVTPAVTPAVTPLVTPAVAAPPGAGAATLSLTPQATAQKWADQLRRLFWKERINGKF